MYTQILFVVLNFWSVIAVSKVPFITKCSPGDSECMTQSTIKALPIFAAGLPEFGVEIMDPFHVEEIDASSPNLKLILKDARVTGLANSLVKKVEFDEKSNKLYLTTELTIDIRGKYEALGQILFLQIEGNGDAHFKINRAAMDFVCDVIPKTGSDGKTYLTVKGAKYSFSLKDKAKIEFENLFGGNEVLSKAAQDLFDTSANELVLDIGDPIIKTFVEKIFANIKHFFRAIPAEDLLIL